MYSCPEYCELGEHTGEHLQQGCREYCELMTKCWPTEVTMLLISVYTMYGTKEELQITIELIMETNLAGNQDTNTGRRKTHSVFLELSDFPLEDNSKLN